MTLPTPKTEQDWLRRTPQTEQDLRDLARAASAEDADWSALPVDPRCRFPGDTLDIYSWADPDEDGVPRFVLAGGYEDDVVATVPGEWPHTCWSRT